MLVKDILIKKELFVFDGTNVYKVFNIHLIYFYLFLSKTQIKRN